MRQLAIVLLVVVVIGGTYYAARTNTGVGPARVQAGVTLEGENIEGYTEAELRVYLDSVIAKQTEPPVQPKVDGVNKGVIPGIAGRKVDRTKTIAEALSASLDEQLAYIWEPVLPEPTPRDIPIYQGSPHKQQITLVVNVAWGNDELVEMLDIFDRYTIKTSFFLVGRWADKFPSLSRRFIGVGMSSVTTLIRIYTYRNYPMQRLPKRSIVPRLLFIRPWVKSR